MSTMRSGAPSRLRSPSPVLSTPARHLANRFSYGITPALADEVRAAGSHEAWFEQQLATAYDGSAANLCDWWPDLNLDPLALWQRNQSGVRAGWSVMQDYGRRTLMRRMTSPRPVLEVMTEFWENHFHVPTIADNIFVYRTAYGDLIRAKALGRFDDLLPAVVLHPAMLFYLGASTSTKAHPNENLGRELLELHTVGVGNHTEADVKDSARILTGFTLDHYRSWAASYAPGNHWTGRVQVLDFADANSSPDGRDVTSRYLRHLAHHPATARRIATKLARVFVSDSPPTALVDRLAQVYLDHDTEILPVLRALVAAPEFGYAVDGKVRDADRDVVATYRLLGAQVAPPTSDKSAANLLHAQAASLGLLPFAWPRPDGKPVDNLAWCSPTRALASMTLHWSMAGASWPSADITYRPYSAWLPSTAPTEFQEVVDHLARQLLQRPASAALVKSCCEATSLTARTKVRPGVGLAAWNWPRLLATVLDSPDFYQY